MTHRFPLALAAAGRLDLRALGELGALLLLGQARAPEVALLLDGRAVVDLGRELGQPLGRRPDVAERRERVRLIRVDGLGRVGLGRVEHLVDIGRRVADLLGGVGRTVLEDGLGAEADEVGDGAALGLVARRLGVEAADDKVLECQLALGDGDCRISSALQRADAPIFSSSVPLMTSL